MYKIWQRKHFPLHGFDEALDQIADIGKTNQLKVTGRLATLPVFRRVTRVLLAYKVSHDALSAQRSSVMQRLQYTIGVGRLVCNNSALACCKR